MMIYSDAIKNGPRPIWNLNFSTMPVINTDDQPNVCAGCGGKIVDRYYLLAVDKQWHVQCLKCCECKLRLDSELTCFAKDGSIYCKEDYYRRFSVKRCARCHLGISANELVMRAKEAVYHLHCFTCASCNKALTTGDHFGMKENIIYCRTHYELSLQGDYMPHLQQNSIGMAGSHALSSAGLPYYNGVGAVHKGRPRKRKSPAPDSDVCPQNIGLNHGDTDSDLDRDSSMGYATSPQAPNSGNNGQSPRTKRMRTSFKHHQLRAMKSYFALNHNPDAKDLKQLAQKTGLTKRVLQVWFQNARAKFRRNLLGQDGQGPEKAAETTSLEDLHNSSSQPMTRDMNQTLSEMHNANVPDDEQSAHALSDLF